MSQNQNIILSIGVEAGLIWFRDAVLRSAGFVVVSTADEESALKEIRKGEWDVLLLYYRLPAGVAERVSAAFRESCSNGRIVVVSSRPMEKPDFADGLHYKIEGPETLIEVIRGLWERAGPNPDL